MIDTGKSRQGFMRISGTEKTDKQKVDAGRSVCNCKAGGSAFQLKFFASPLRILCAGVASHMDWAGACYMTPYFFNFKCRVRRVMPRRRAASLLFPPASSRVLRIVVFSTDSRDVSLPAAAAA